MKLILILMAVFSHTQAFSKAVPEFSLKGHDGRSYKLSDYKGKLVVLEWLNYGCPFVQKHYHAAHENMQKLQRKYTAKDVVWFSVISSAPGKQGHSSPQQATADYEKYGSSATAVLIDESGEVGKLYGAKTTPHMFVIGKDQEMIYAGAIDDNASYDPEDIPGANNYVAQALEATIKGKKVAVNQTEAYGCSIKY